MTDISTEEIIRNIERDIRNAKPGSMIPVPADVSLRDIKPPPVVPEYEFVELARKTAEALIEATQRAVNEAANLLERNKAHAQGYIADHVKHAEELSKVEQRLRTLGDDTLNAHEKYAKNGSGE